METQIPCCGFFVRMVNIWPAWDNNKQNADFAEEPSKADKKMLVSVRLVFGYFSNRFHFVEIIFALTFYLYSQNAYLTEGSCQQIRQKTRPTKVYPAMIPWQTCKANNQPVN
jgi:hypothetical protein